MCWMPNSCITQNSRLRLLYYFVLSYRNEQSTLFSSSGFNLCSRERFLAHVYHVALPAETFAPATTIMGSSDDAYRSFCNLLDNTSHDNHEVAAGLSIDEVVQLAQKQDLNDNTSDFRTDHVTSSEIDSKVELPRCDAFDSDIACVRAAVIGRLKRFPTPFSRYMPLVYADWTATGRAVCQIESYLYDEVMPLFGNTHTTTSITGSQTTCFRHEARQIIAQAVNAKVCAPCDPELICIRKNQLNMTPTLLSW